MPAYYLTTDLFFSSRVCAAAQRLGVDLQTVPKVDSLQEADDNVPLVLIDLQLRGLDLATAVPTLRQRFPSARIVAYAPHVQEGTLQAAQEAGCDEVLSRGQFDRDLQRLLSL